MEEEKLPPPMPDKNARTWNCHKGVSGVCRAKPAPMAGIINNAVVKTMVFLPPEMRIKNVLGIRKVAPVRPAIAARVKSSDFSKLKTQVNHLNGDNSPVKPDGEAA